MNVDPSDVAHLSDDELKALAVGAHEAGDRFFEAISRELVRLVKGRRRDLALLELELFNADDAGCLVVDLDDETVAELEAETRRSRGEAP